ncbi:MAG: ParB N-terminal domain-containing protein [Robiginitomaculum sp.]
MSQMQNPISALTLEPIARLPLTAFHSESAPKLWSRESVDIHSLAKAIARDGLLSPLTALAVGEGRYAITDGHKRLAALRLLAQTGGLPRSLSQSVPCVIVSESGARLANAPHPSLKTDAELAEAIIAAHKAGANRAGLTRRFACAPLCVSYALSLSALHPHIRNYFNAGHLSLEQAAAFATLPNMDAQWRLLQELGPFAHASEVIKAILGGATVIETPDGEVMILPSRAALPMQSARRAAA